MIYVITDLKAQEESSIPNTKDEIESQYEQNARKATIHGTYIPKDMDEALERLKNLSSEEALKKFKEAPEEGIDRKLHFGLGRWMIVNWYFYEGSRFEHYLRELGLIHPDDMADFMIICLHRSLNNKELDIKNLVTYYSGKRKEEMERRKNDLQNNNLRKITD